MVDAKLTDREIKGMVYSHTGSNPVLTTKKLKTMKISIEIHLLEWHLVPFKTALGFTWLCFDFNKY
jgi:hypothetical protein